MNLLLRGLVLTLLATTAVPALAQNNIVPPEPLPMATAYVYPSAYYPAFYITPPLSLPSPAVSVVAYYPPPGFVYASPYPFGSYTPTFGLYSWDYGVYYPTAYGWYPYSIVNYPSVYRFPLPLGRVWLR